MSYRRRSAPVSTLRVRLQQRLEEKGVWEGKGDFTPDEPAPTGKSFSPVGILKSMHRYLLIKVTAAVVLVFIAALLTRGGYTWSGPLLQGLRYVVEWDLDPGALTEKAAPAFRALWDDWEPLPAGSGQSAPVMLPLAGTNQSGFGLRPDSAAGREEMHYGIDLAAPEGTPVKALLGGRVQEIITGGEDTAVSVIIACESSWLMLYRGLTAVRVKEGDAVECGALLGNLGAPRLYELPHLHFELRYGGRPVAPPAGWTAQFAEDPGNAS